MMIREDKPAGAWFMSDKPIAAFVLILIAAILDFIIGIAIFAYGSLALLIVGYSVVASWIVGIIYGLAAWWIICGALLVMASMWINSGDPGKVRNGGIVAIIFSILSLNLFVIILGIIGGVLALTWKPSSPGSPVKASPEQTPEETI